MYRSEQNMPPEWPAYTDPTGYRWRLAPNGRWWLGYGLGWYAADNPDDKIFSVLGVTVPSVSQGKDQNWLAPQPIAPGAPSYLYYGGGGSACTTVVQHSGTAIQKAPNAAQAPPVAPPVKPADPPNVPPDFAESPLGPGCCQQCHLDDGPLYDGELCRYCWILSHHAPYSNAITTARTRSPWHSVTTWALALIAVTALAVLLGVLYSVG